jgi:GAF domain-containing protein/ANTAR domain-containing protein
MDVDGAAAGAGQALGSSVESRLQDALADEPGFELAELLPARLAHATAIALPASGAAISLIEEAFRVPLGSSDDNATLAERLQFTQGEGPCLDAVRTRAAVAVSTAEMTARWPTFAGELRAHTPYHAAVSVPVLFDGLVGAVDLFFDDDDALQDVRFADVTRVCDIISGILSSAAPLGPAGTRDTGAQDDDQPAWTRAEAALERRTVWVAVGMVMVSTHLDADDALAALRADAYGRGSTLDAVAADLVAGVRSTDELLER